MNKLISIILTLITVTITSLLYASDSIEQEKPMYAEGSFDINLEPQKDDSAPVGRMIINKTYNGAVIGAGIGQMISKRTESGKAVYFAIEEFTGTVDGKEGAFTLLHKGVMDKNSQSLDISILEGSGTAELENITGTMSINIHEDGSHTYELRYQL